MAHRRLGPLHFGRVDTGRKSSGHPRPRHLASKVAPADERLLRSERWEGPAMRLSQLDGAGAGCRPRWYGRVQVSQPSTDGPRPFSRPRRPPPAYLPSRDRALSRRSHALPYRALSCHLPHSSSTPACSRASRSSGFARPTPIQADAIPPALEGRDVLACAMTGSGKTAAFLLPILHRLIDKPRGTTRALVLTPTRELAAQIVEDLNDLAVHTPLTGARGLRRRRHGAAGARVPQRRRRHRRARRAGCSITSARPTRSSPASSILVLDEADRMLDMGFLPDIRRVLRHLPPKRQTLFFSATMPPPIAGALARDAARSGRRSTSSGRPAPAVGITQAVYPVPQELKAALLLALLKRGDMQDALVFTRTKHRANRLAEVPRRSTGSAAERIHGNRSQAQRTEALAGFKSGKYRVLVATDIAARGHRRRGARPRRQLRRAARAGGLHPPRRPHRARRGDGRRVHVRLAGGGARSAAASSGRSASGCRASLVPDFDYAAKPAARLEVPLARADRRDQESEGSRASESRALIAPTVRSATPWTRIGPALPASAKPFPACVLPPP